MALTCPGCFHEKVNRKHLSLHFDCCKSYLAEQKLLRPAVNAVGQACEARHLTSEQARLRTLTTAQAVSENFFELWIRKLPQPRIVSACGGEGKLYECELDLQLDQVIREQSGNRQRAEAAGNKGWKVGVDAAYAGVLGAVDRAAAQRRRRRAQLTRNDEASPAEALETTDRKKRGKKASRKRAERTLQAARNSPSANSQVPVLPASPELELGASPPRASPSRSRATPSAGKGRELGR